MVVPGSWFLGWNGARGGEHADSDVCKDPTSGIFNGTTTKYKTEGGNSVVKSFVLPNGKKWEEPSGISVGFAKEKDVCVGYKQKNAAANLSASAATSMIFVVAAVYALLA